jgi:hypothetical protein
VATVTHDPWAEDAPIRRRNPGCLAAVAVLILGALVVSVVINIIESVAVDIAVLVVLVAAGYGAYVFFRGPPEP